MNKHIKLIWTNNTFKYEKHIEEIAICILICVCVKCVCFVHLYCSAGLGRSGTFIAIDMGIEQVCLDMICNPVYFIQFPCNPNEVTCVRKVTWKLEN